MSRKEVGRERVEREGVGSREEVRREGLGNKDVGKATGRQQGVSTKGAGKNIWRR